MSVPCMAALPHPMPQPHLFSGGTRLGGIQTLLSPLHDHVPQGSQASTHLQGCGPVQLLGFLQAQWNHGNSNTFTRIRNMISRPTTHISLESYPEAPTTQVHPPHICDARPIVSHPSGWSISMLLLSSASSSFSSCKLELTKLSSKATVSRTQVLLVALVEARRHMSEADPGTQTHSSSSAPPQLQTCAQE